MQVTIGGATGMVVNNGVVALKNCRSRRCFRGMTSCVGGGVSRLDTVPNCDERPVRAGRALVDLGVASSCFGTGGRTRIFRRSLRRGSRRVCSLGRRLVSLHVRVRRTRGRRRRTLRRGDLLRKGGGRLRGRVSRLLGWREKSCFNSFPFVVYFVYVQFRCCDGTRGWYVWSSYCEGHRM